MNETTTQSYFPPGTAIPVAQNDGLDKPFWEGLREGKLRIQHCTNCGTWQHAAEWLCHNCLSFDHLEFREVAPKGRIYSWTRVWHPTHPALNERCPYICVVVELPEAGGIRMEGNLLGDDNQEVRVCADVTGVFELHPDAEPPFALLQWKYTEPEA